MKGAYLELESELTDAHREIRDLKERLRDLERTVARMDRELSTTKNTMDRWLGGDK